MQMEIRRAADRGHADHGWLDSHHSFSFANYYDRRFMGFGPLRVINQDRVAPGRGFGTHPHRNMEIISYVVDGALEHKDTLGTGSVIRPGEVQIMSAGSGIAHSEYNHSKTEGVHFLQIWVLPRRAGTPPRYDQKAFPTDRALSLVVSGDGREGSLQIDQDIDLWRLLLPDGGSESLELRHAKRAWVQVVRGELQVNDVLLQPGDGLAIQDAQTLRLLAQGDVEALLFDMP